MRRSLKILRWIFLLLLLLIGGAGAWLYWNQDKLIREAVQALNAQLSEPVEVEQVQVSLSRFPSAAIQLQGIFSRGRGGAQRDTLFYFDDAYLEFDLWQVWTGSMSIDQISLENGTLRLYTDAQGRSNYEIWKKNSTRPDTGGSFALKAVELREVRTIYHHVPSQFRSVAQVSLAQLRGNFQAQQFQLEQALNLEIQKIQQGGREYLAAPQPLEALLEMKSDARGWQLNSSRLKLSDWGKAELQLEDAAPGMKVRLRFPELRMAKIWPWLERQNYVPKELLQLSGDADLEINYRQNAEDRSHLHLAYGLKKAALQSESYGDYAPLELQAHYHWWDQGDTLEIKELRLRDKKRPLQARGSIVNLSSPELKAELQADWPLASWAQLLPGAQWTAQGGRARVELSWADRYASWEELSDPKQVRNARVRGSVKVENASFRIEDLDWQIRECNGALQWEKDAVRLERFYFRKGRSDVFLAGKVENVLQYALFSDQELRVDGRVRSQELVLEDFLDFTASQDSTAARPLEHLRQLDMQLRVGVDKLSFRQFRAQELQGKLQIGDGSLQVKDLGMKADQGRYSGNFSIAMPEGKAYQLQAQLKAEDIHLESAFASFEDFGQSSLTAANLEGRTWIDAQIKARMSPQLDIELPSLETVAELRIEEGRLHNYPPMLELSRFAAVEELRDVRFAELSNTIRIREEVIQLPAMDISSNVLDINLQGRHTFDNYVDYLVRVELGKVLFGKRDKQQADPTLQEHLEITPRQDDHILPVSIRGPLENVKVQVDKNALGEDFRQGWQEQGEDLKNIFRKDTAPASSESELIFKWEEEEDDDAQ